MHPERWRLQLFAAPHMLAASTRSYELHRSITLTLISLALVSSSLSGQEPKPAPKASPASGAEATPVPLPEDAKAALSKSQATEPETTEPETTKPETTKPAGVKIAKLTGLTSLSDKFGLWVDMKRKWVVIDGKVCLSRGVLEMFACPRGTKEHESVISVDCPSRFVHAALLAVGAKAGRPVQFDPAYLPANGQVIDVHILWIDKDGKRRSVKAQEWIRNTKTKEEIQHPFVFAGSGFWEEMVDGKPFEHYLADAGDLICVSNFPSAMLDLPIKSSKENSSLLYEAYPGRIPPRGTRIRLVLIPSD